jgi:hypothetical protein
VIDPCSSGGGEQHPADTVGGSVEQRVRSAAQGRCLPRVCHHVREGAAGAEARDGAALPPVRLPPVEEPPAHERRSKVARRRASTEKPAGAIRAG